MPRPDHRRESLLPALRVKQVGGEWTEATPTRELHRGVYPLGIGKVPRLAGILLVDPRGVESLSDPSSAITAAGERPRLADREGGVIDVAEAA